MGDSRNDKEKILYYKKESEKILEDFYNEIENEFKKYEKEYPEIGNNFRRLRKCKNMQERWVISLENLRLSYKLVKVHSK
jgi:hypothetical protein